MDLKGITAVVTGGASGLGEATIRLLMENGVNAAIMDLDEKRGAALAEELGPEAIFCKTDVTDEASVQEAMDKAVKAFGGIQALVNCAGVGFPAKVIGKEGPTPLQHFKKVVDINLIGSINVARLAAAKMLENQPNSDGEKGVVINTASVAAFDGQIGQVAYAASKAGVAGMTLPMAREFADYGIRVMTIAPGLFLTPMLMGLPEKVQTSLAQTVPFPKRLGNPLEYAMLARHIIENPMLNGETIRLDGCIRMTAR